MLEVVNSDMWLGYAKDDPVRPHLSMYFRVTENRTMFVLLHPDKYEPRAIVCTALTDDIAKTEEDLTIEGDNVVMFYTVWSYDRGAGREIISNVVDWIRENKPSVKRFVTLSPMTDTAYRFHTRNGAKELQINKDTVNYEYEV